MMSKLNTFRLDSLLFIEMCISFDSTTSYIIAENDPSHLVPDVRLMMTCELTSGSVIGHVGTGALSSCIFRPIYMQISLCSAEILACYDIQSVPD